MKRVEHLSEPTHLVAPVQSHILPAIYGDVIVTVCERSVHLFRLPEFEAFGSRQFDHSVTAVAVTKDFIYIGLNTLSQSNSGEIVQLALPDMTEERKITIQQPPHILRAHGSYLAVGMGKFARLYLDFRETAEVELQREIAGLELFDTSMLVFNAEESRIWSPEGEVELEVIVTTATIFQNEWIVSARDNTLSFVSLSGKISKQRFFNTYFYQIAVYGKVAIAVGEEGKIFAFDLLQEQKGLVFDELFKILVDGSEIDNIVYISTGSGYLYAQDSESTMLAVSLRGTREVGDNIYCRSFEQVATRFGEILAIAKLNELLIFCSGSPQLFVARQGTIFVDALRNHTEPITHVCERAGFIFSVSADSVIVWKLVLPGTTREFEGDTGNSAEQETTSTNSLFGGETERIPFYEICKETLVAVCKMRLPSLAQITAFDVIVGKTRSTMALSVKNDIETLEIHNFLISDEYMVITPEFQVITAHTDFVNALLFLNHELLVSGSADKSVALWDVEHTKREKEVTPQQEETIYDIFTNRVDKRRRLVVESEDSKIERQQEIQNLSRRTIWHISRLGSLLCVSCGDKKVRLLKLANKELSVVKTLEGYQFSVVKSLFLSETEVLSLQSEGIVTIVNTGTGETEYTQNMRLYAEAIMDEVHIKNEIAGIEAESNKVEFGTYAICADEQGFLVGTSTGAILSIKDDSEVLRIQNEELEVQTIENMQLFNDNLRDRKFAEGIMVAVQERDASLLYEAVAAGLDAGWKGSLSSLDLDECYFLLETSLKWLRLAKRYLVGVFVLNAILLQAPLDYLIKAYGEQCTLHLREALRFLEKHRERVAEIRGQTRVI